jgi:hypothetical protein
MRWRQLDSGVSAVSFGFVATAILVSMFLAMAILEHFLRAPSRARGMGMGPPSAPSPPQGGILFRLRFLLLRRGGGEAGFPGSDLEAARKLDGRASPEVWHRRTQLPHAPPPTHPIRFSLLMIPSSRPFRNFPFSHRLPRFSALCFSAFDGPKLPIISFRPFPSSTTLGSAMIQRWLGLGGISRGCRNRNEEEKALALSISCLSFL